MANFRGPASSQHYNSGAGSPEFFFDLSVSQLSALATLRPIWGRVGQGAFELSLPQLGSAIFWSDPCVFGYIY